MKLFKERKYSCTVKLLDGEEFQTDVTKSTIGKDLLDTVCKHVGLEEIDFFGIKYKCAKDGQLSWLDNAKTIGKQIGAGPYQVVFQVKFYPPHPSSVQEDITRYQIVLQVRDDLLKERLVCSVPIHALLASYLIQAEKGDFDHCEHGPDYLKDLNFMPSQTDDFLERVREFHKKHNGLTPADAEYQYLDNARKIPLFGMDLHDAFDGENTSVILGVSESGFHVIQKGRQISKFAWSNVHKVYFKSKRFFLDMRVVTETEYEDLTVGFKCRSRTELKRLYRSAVDFHTFFRRDAAVLGSQKVSFFKLGSKFRYSGRKTFQQLRTSNKSRVPPSFERVSSMRLSKAGSSKKSPDSDEKKKIPNSKEKEEHETPRKDSLDKDARDKTDDESPCISRDILIVPNDEESNVDTENPSAETKKNLLPNPIVSINILPPTPSLTPAHKHHGNKEADADKEADDSSATASETEAEVVIVKQETETVEAASEEKANAHENETTVTKETNVEETIVNGETEITTKTVITTTTTEIVTVEDESEEMVIIEEATETSTKEG